MPKHQKKPAAARDEALEQELLDHPEDPAPFARYATWLRGEGNALGELIERMLRGGSSSAIAMSDEDRAFVVTHADDILGPQLATAVRKTDNFEKPHVWFEAFFEPRWRFGYIDSVRIRSRNAGRSVGILTRLLLESPAAGLLRHMILGETSESSRFVDALTAIGEVSAPRLESLNVGEGCGVRSSLGDFAPCWKALPRLRKLSLAGKRVELGDIVAPVLEQFELRGGGLTEDNVRSVASATWPMLSTLIIWFGATRVPSPAYAVDIHYTSPFDGRSPAVLDILSGRNLAKVTFLGLMNTNFTDELCASLHTSKILPQLSVLDLSKGTMTEHGARHLLEHAAAYEHLEYLNVDENLIMDLDVRTALLETFPQIDFGVQRAPYGVMSVADLR